MISTYTLKVFAELASILLLSHAHTSSLVFSEFYIVSIPL